MSDIERDFRLALNRWRKHIAEKSYFSMSGPYLDCDAYRELVSMGIETLPHIHNQLSKEIKTDNFYENWLNKIKVRVFETVDVELFDDKYHIISKDEEFQEYSKGYDKDVIGRPGMLWCQLLYEIAPDFEIPRDIAGKVKKMEEFALKWLDENMGKYLAEVLDENLTKHVNSMDED
ncbi:MAG: hypothetical protein ABIF08_04630 [Nanoarchaeota archaeon]